MEVVTEHVFPRPMRFDERALLDEVLAIGLPNREDIRQALQSSLVKRICECGCGSFEVTVDESALHRDFERLVVDMETPVARVEGAVVGTVLFVERDGTLLDLTWYCEDEQRPARLPRPDELESPRWKQTDESSWTLENFD